MIYINAQEKAKLDTRGRTDRGSVVDDPSQQYNIPKFINEWDSVTQTYKKQSAQNTLKIRRKKLQTNSPKVRPPDIMTTVAMIPICKDFLSN